MTGEERVNHDRGPNQRKRNKKQPDLWSGKILSCDRANLGANGGAGVHNECNENIDVPFQRVGKVP